MRTWDQGPGIHEDVQEDPYQRESKKNRGRRGGAVADGEEKDVLLCSLMPGLLMAMVQQKRKVLCSLFS